MNIFEEAEQILNRYGIKGRECTIDGTPDGFCYVQQSHLVTWVDCYFIDWRPYYKMFFESSFGNLTNDEKHGGVCLNNKKELDKFVSIIKEFGKPRGK